MRKRSEAIAARKAKTEEEKRAAVEEISGELRDVIRTEAETPPGGYAPPPKKYAFPSAQKPGRDPDLREDLRQIVETHWIEDMHGSWLRIRGALKVGEKRSHHGHLHTALDNARELANEAHALFVTAKLEAKRWENANEVTHGAMWAEASRALEYERETKVRSKAITDTDVRAKVATLYPDEWNAQELDREKVKLTVDRMSDLAKQANEKVEDIRTMLSKLRG